MIADRIANAASYSAFRDLAKAFEYLAGTDFAQVKPGKYEIDGDRIFALVQDASTRPLAECRFEAHRKYIDVQYIVDGFERMYYRDVGDLKPAVPYDESKDVAFYTGEGDYVSAPAGTFVVFFPQDAHIPSVAADSPRAVRKVVVKVRG